LIRAAIAQDTFNRVAGDEVFFPRSLIKMNRIYSRDESEKALRGSM
jgi:hypothetical protein